MSKDEIKQFVFAFSLKALHVLNFVLLTVRLSTELAAAFLRHLLLYIAHLLVVFLAVLQTHISGILLDDKHQQVLRYSSVLGFVWIDQDLILPLVYG